MSRTLGAARLSRKTDESTSIERQREQITYYADAPGTDRTLVGITEDTDISGSISPFAREGLGPWLTDPDKITLWDTLAITKLDRLTRSLRDFDELVEWLDANGKTLVSLSEALDLSTPTGRMFANILAMFAQFERERIGERRREAGVKMRENGWWQGGQPNYGYRPVKVESHWELREDPAQRGILERIARQLIAGKARRAIGRDLDADGIPTPKSAKSWEERTITSILRKIIENEDPILDDHTRARVSEALDSSGVGWTKRGDTALKAYCKCGKPLYARRWVHKPTGKLYEYYSCSVKCGQPGIPMADLDAAVDDHIWLNYGLEPVWRKVTTRGKSNRAQITVIERKIRALDLDADDYDEQLAELRGQRKRLQDADRKNPDRTEYEDTGLKVRDYWPLLTRAAKRQFLTEAGIKVLDARRDGNHVSCIVEHSGNVLRFVVTGDA